MSFKGFFGHLHTINHHRFLVCKHCFKAGIPFHGLTHDLSKYSLTEFIPGCKYFQGSRSPNEKEREILGYSKAWLHHKGRNKHHFEYWSDYNMKEHKYMPVKMPIKYVKEMFCDRIAASKTYKKKDYTDAASIDYYLSHNTRDKMHPETADLLEKWLIMLKEQGEASTFKEIRKTKSY